MSTAADGREYSLGELAVRLGGTVVGDGDKRIRGVRGIEDAGPDELTFVSNPKYSAHARSTRAGAVLVAHDFPEIAAATLRVDDPYLTLASAIALFHRAPTYPPGIHPTAVIGDGVRLGQNIHIGPYVVLMNDVVLGDDSVVLPHAVIYSGVRTGNRLLVHAHAVIREECLLGDDVVLQPGVIVGGDGFGFARRADGGWQKIPQAGRVIIESGVEIQANSCVDRGALGDTTIQAGAKIDNLVQVGHGSSVGKATLLCAQVGLAGSTVVGDRVILAGQVGVAGHCKIGDGVVATAQSGIPGDVEPGMTVSGYPAVENRQWLKSVAALNRLPGVLRNLYKERR